ncbi:MAG: protease modulator HflC [bacterium]
MGKKQNITILVSFLFIIISTGFYIVDETEQAVILKFGKPMTVVKKAGLKIKIPLIQQVIHLDKRIRDSDINIGEIHTKDKKNLLVDAFCKWRIIDPIKFLDVISDKGKVRNIVSPELRENLSLYNWQEIIGTTASNDSTSSPAQPINDTTTQLSFSDESLMTRVTNQCNLKAKDYGIEIIDVRIKRVDLLYDNKKEILSNMKTDKGKEVDRYKKEGKREAAKIKSEADKEKTIILSNAYKEEQKIRGEGDKEAARIYSLAYEQDSDFFQFLKTMEVYKTSLKNDTTLILSPNSEFFKYLGNH